MANTVIKLKKSSVPSETPSALEYGELAINYADGILYYKNSTGQIVSFSSSVVANVSSFATINANNSLITATATNSILTISNGDNIEIAGDIINDIITIKANLKPAFDAANQAGIIANAAFDMANTGTPGGSSNSFTTIFVPGQSNVVASVNDTLNITTGSGINIQTNAVSKTVSFSIPPGTYSGDYGFIYEAVTSTNDYGSI